MKSVVGYAPCNKPCIDVRGYDILLEISTMLSAKEIDLDCVLRVLGEELSVSRLMLTLFNRESNNIITSGAYGLSDREMQSGVYRVGEGIIGRVVERGEAVVIDNIATSKLFLNRTNMPINHSSDPISFICLPVKYQEKIVGTLSFHKCIAIDDKINDGDVRLLKVVAGMIGRSLRRRQEYAEEMEKLKRENDRLKGSIKRFTSDSVCIKGKSSKVNELFSLIESVAPTEATVIIRGESGVGKELIADAICQNSHREGRPFVKVNCAALPESLIESELFGHEKGAFTGAVQRRIGRFEAADGGTIFLDEFGDIPAPIQIKLLRVLQEREIQRVGGTESIKVDVRIICATNRNLESMIAQGEFREDLYYRINVFPIYVPPLRERVNDIPILIDHFIESLNNRYNKGVKRITSSAINTLMIYNWPGNIRELENCIERAYILCDGGVIRSHNLPPTLQTAESSDSHIKGGSLDVIMGNLERQVIIDALTMSKGNIAKAAVSLGVTERVMGLRVLKYNIDPKQYKV